MAPLTNAQVWLAPAVIAVTPAVNPDTCTGVEEVNTNEPSPSNRFIPLKPQHFAAPLTMAQVWLAPAAIAVTPLLNPVTGTGMLELVVVPFPNWA